MMKRLVTYNIEDDKKKVISISAPINENDLNIEQYLESNIGIINGEYTNPPIIENKKIELYYDSDTQTIIYEYVDIDFNDLSGVQQIEFLRNEINLLTDTNSILKDTVNELQTENKLLREELELTQLALFEVDAKIESSITN